LKRNGIKVYLDQWVQRWYFSLWSLIFLFGAHPQFFNNIRISFWCSPWVGEISQKILSVDFSRGLGISPIIGIGYINGIYNTWYWYEYRFLNKCVNRFKYIILCWKLINLGVKLIHSNQEDHTDWGALRESLENNTLNFLLLFNFKISTKTFLIAKSLGYNTLNFAEGAKKREKS